jgi:hypothetical protein
MNNKIRPIAAYLRLSLFFASYYRRDRVRMMKNSVDYMLSLHVLKELKAKNLISEDEFTAIDLLNKKSFNSL